MDAAKLAAAADHDSILDGGHAVDAIFRRQRILGKHREHRPRRRHGGCAGLFEEINPAAASER